jgi:hypothetical protein
MQPVERLDPAPDPRAHQRYEEFLPRRSYEIRESELQWSFHPDGPYTVERGAWLIERVEHEAELVPDPGAYPSPSLGPGQRFASKGCWIVRLDPAAPGGLAPIGPWRRVRAATSLPPRPAPRASCGSPPSRRRRCAASPR